MNRLSVALISAIAGIAFTQSASAADLPYKAPPVAAPMAPAFSWTGFYVGGNIGYGWGDNGSRLHPSADTSSQNFWNPAFNAGAAPSVFDFSQSGVIGGIQIGYNHQFNNWVLGWEADFQGANIDDSASVATSGIVPFVDGFFSSSQDLRWLGTVRGRVGATWDRVLLYVTGGFAYGNVKYDLNFAFPGSDDFHSISANHTSPGWTVGGGLEWAAWDRWSFKVEYLYVDLGTTSLVSTPSGRAPNLLTTVTEDFDNKYSIVRVGANYRF